MVIWLIGLSGAGKTTLGRAVVDRASAVRPVFIDGDVIRELFGNDLGYTLEDRWQNAQRISRLCRFLDDQRIPVVCAILSLFPESRSWNRKHIKNYYEVFIDAPLDQLVARDPKDLYKKARAGEMKNVAGIDLPFTPPENPDLIIENAADVGGLLAFAPRLAAILAE